MGPNPNGPLSKLLELLDTQVEGSVQWVMLDFFWIGVLKHSREIALVNLYEIALLKRIRPPQCTEKRGGNQTEPKKGMHQFHETTAKKKPTLVDIFGQVNTCPLSL